MSISRSLVSTVVFLCWACSSEIELYPGLGPSASCETHSFLCELPLVDLGGGSTRATFHIVFAGDGFRDDIDNIEFTEVVDAFVQQLQQDKEGFVAWEPHLFHFYRVDLFSRSELVADDELRNTPLATHLEPGCIRPFIRAHEPYLDLVAQNVPASKSSKVHVVHLARQIDGRANATMGGHVRMSTFHNYDTLKHELGHALYWLGDEYTECSWCPDQEVLNSVSVQPIATELELLSLPNVSRQDHPAKWQGLVRTVESGGAGWPCFFHPTESCVMLGVGDTFCPVCQQAIHEVHSARRCGGDAYPPRVVILPQTSWPKEGKLSFVAAAHDERSLQHTEWLLDGDAVAPSKIFQMSGPALTVELAGLEAGEHELVAVVVDAAGNRGRSAPHSIHVDQSQHPQVLEASATVDDFGWTWVEVSAQPIGGWVEVTLANEPPVYQRLASRSSNLVIPAKKGFAGKNTVHVRSLSPSQIVGSPPMELSLDVPGEVKGEPPLVTYSGAFANPSNHFLLDLAVESKTPVVELGLATADGVVWVSESTTPQHRDSRHVLPIEMPFAPQKQRQLYVYAVDAWGRRGETELLVRDGFVDHNSCDFFAHLSAEEKMYGLASTFTVTLQGQLFRTKPKVFWSTQKGAWHQLNNVYMPLHSAEVRFYPREIVKTLKEEATFHQGDALRLAISGEVLCEDWTAVTQQFEVQADFVPPEIFVTGVAQGASQADVDCAEANWFIVGAVDGAGISWVKAVWPNGDVDVVRKPPFRFPARGERVTIEASDLAGNRTQQHMDIHLTPEHRLAGRCDEVEPW